MSYSRFNNDPEYFYHIGKDIISEVTAVTIIRDLWIMLNNSFNYDNHINYTINKANSILGFVMRSVSNFKNGLAFKILYFSLVKNIIEFASTL